MFDSFAIETTRFMWQVNTLITLKVSDTPTFFKVSKQVFPAPI